MRSSDLEPMAHAGSPKSVTFSGLLDEVASRYGGGHAVVCDGDGLTYQQLKSESERVARSLLHLGVRRGDKVAGLISNRPEWLVLCFGAARIGAVFAPLNTWYQRDEIVWALRHLKAVALIAEVSFLRHDYAADLAEALPELGHGQPGDLHTKELPALRTVVFLDGRRPGAYEWGEFTDLGREVPESDLRGAEAAVRPRDLLYILYTSGSTAEPKGVMLQHHATVENCFNIGERRAISSDDRVWLGSALFYGLGAVNALPAVISHGGTLVLQRRFEPLQALNLIERHQCTVFYGMSNMIRAIYEHPAYSREKVSSLLKGSASISVEERRILIEEMGAHMATQSYGMTETHGNCTGGHVDDPLDLKLSTIGRPLPGWDLRVVDPDTLKPLPRGHVGLLIARGYTTDGYHGQPEETEELFSDDGFLKTGDLCSLDRDGYVRYHGRLKEVIKTGGINVSPTEVEALLLGHPGVQQAYVIGLPDARQGEVVVAFVEPVAAITESEVKTFLRDRVASFKIPRNVFLRKDHEIPRLASGKVARVQLREEAMRELGLG